MSSPAAAAAAAAGVAADLGARPLDLALARAAAEHVRAYPFKTWGFGEEIALKALLQLADASDDRSYGCWVRSLVDGWCATRGPLGPADHVAPGSVLLELYERRGGEHLLEAALELAELLVAFPRERGVRVHRRDLEGLDHLVWVDCMALDGPFLSRLALATGDGRWAAEAVDAATSYARALQDGGGLFRHGFDVREGARSPCRWARGNGWALHGLVDTLEALPADAAGADELRDRLAALAAALPLLQHPNGLWHTVLDDPTTPLEASTAALFASGLAKALRLGLLRDVPPALDRDATDRAIDRALDALREHVRPDGALEISSATPVGDREVYARQSTGVFPWGQGPLILAILEARSRQPARGGAQGDTGGAA